MNPLAGVVAAVAAIALAAVALGLLALFQTRVPAGGADRHAREKESRPAAYEGHQKGCRKRDQAGVHGMLRKRSFRLAISWIFTP